MSEEHAFPSVETRLAALERQLALWRAAAVCALFVFALGATMAFRRFAPGPVDATSLTLHGPQGAVVMLSLRPDGDLEARFSVSADGSLRTPRGSGLALVNTEEREVIRIGAPAARQLAP